MNPKDARALMQSAINLRFALSRLDYLALILKLGVRRPHVFDIHPITILEP